MLVLNRKIGERIFIGPGIEIAIVDVRGSKVRIGIEAPADIRIRRVEPAGAARLEIDRAGAMSSAADG
jgi:carbon storage regulator